LLGPDTRGLVARLDELAAARTHRLRLHDRNRNEKSSWLLKLLVPREGMLSRRR
jgi:hypothetical protein